MDADYRAASWHEFYQFDGGRNFVNGEDRATPAAVRAAGSAVREVSCIPQNSSLPESCITRLSVSVLPASPKLLGLSKLTLTE